MTSPTYDNIVIGCGSGVATFGLNEKQLIERNIQYERLELDFEDDDRAIVDNHQYAKMILFISSKGLLKRQKKQLEASRLTHYFEAALSVDEFQMYKPHTDTYKKALEKLEVQPEEV